MMKQYSAANEKGADCYMKKYTAPSLKIDYFEEVAAESYMSGAVTNAAINGNHDSAGQGSAAARTVRLQTIIRLNRGGN